MGSGKLPTYNKLVRDNILEMIKADNLSYHAKTLNSEELLVQIKKKMMEEANEFNEANTNKDTIEELADILELVYAAVSSLDISYEQLEEIRKQKKLQRGGFEKALFLIDVVDK